MRQSIPLNQENGKRKWLILAVISFSLFMILLDVTIVNIALPHIMTAFDVDLSSVEWVFNVYVLVLLLHCSLWGNWVTSLVADYCSSSAWAFSLYLHWDVVLLPNIIYC